MNPIYSGTTIDDATSRIEYLLFVTPVTVHEQRSGDMVLFVPIDSKQETFSRHIYCRNQRNEYHAKYCNTTMPQEHDVSRQNM